MTQWDNKSVLKGLTITLKEGSIVRINQGELRMQLVQTRGRFARVSFEAAKEITIEREGK